MDIKNPLFKKVIFDEDVTDILPNEVRDFIYEIPAGEEEIIINFGINARVYKAIAYVNVNRFFDFIREEKAKPINDCIKLVNWSNNRDNAREGFAMLFELEFINPIQAHMHAYRQLITTGLNEGENVDYLLRLEDCRRFKTELLMFWEKGGLPGSPQFSKFVLWLNDYDASSKRLLEVLKLKK